VDAPVGAAAPALGRDTNVAAASISVSSRRHGGAADPTQVLAQDGAANNWRST